MATTVDKRKKKWLVFMDTNTNQRTIVLINYNGDLPHQVGKVFGDSVCHWHMYTMVEKGEIYGLIPEWVNNCPKSAHVVIEVNASNKQEAVELCKKLREFEAERSQD
ncbi:MAG: hypothetical protein GX094_05210 [Clostridiales bacterium]|jgi:hypothetical protein|nr:hypothetical protein [Clostridiales bacterium]